MTIDIVSVILVIALLLGVLMLVRAGVALASPPMQTALDFSLINVLVYFTAAMGQLAIGLGCHFMLMIRRNAVLEALSTTTIAMRPKLP